MTGLTKSIYYLQTWIKSAPFPTSIDQIWQLLKSVCVGDIFVKDKKIILNQLHVLYVTFLLSSSPVIHYM